MGQHIWKLFAFFFLFHKLINPLVAMNIFSVMFSSLSFDSVILLLIVSAGQLTKMAALPSGSLWLYFTNKRTDEENSKEK